MPGRGGRSGKVVWQGRYLAVLHESGYLLSFHQLTEKIGSDEVCKQRFWAPWKNSAPRTKRSVSSEISLKVTTLVP